MSSGGGISDCAVGFSYSYEQRISLASSRAAICDHFTSHTFAIDQPILRVGKLSQGYVVDIDGVSEKSGNIFN